MKIKNNQRKIEKFILIFVFVIMKLFLASAVNVGISPATVTFENVLRNGYSERTVVISVDSDSPVLIEVKPRGEIEDWLSLPYNNFTVSKSKPHSFKFSVSPPIDVPNGNYTGFLRFMSGELGEGVEGNAVSIVRTSLDLAMTVGVTDIELRDCNAYDFDVQSVEEGEDISFSFEVKNNGNIRLRPRVVIDIWDQDQDQVLKSEDFLIEEILPTTEREFVLKMGSEGLDLGQYWADISVVDCYSSQIMTFDVLEEGALRAEGVLLGILVNKTADLGATIPIEVSFKNTGEKDVEAYFKGKVSLGDKIIQILETDKINVPMESIEKFNLFFTPADTGKYIINGRVFYSGKKTFELSSTLEVVRGGQGLRGVVSAFFIPLVYIVLILVIGILFFKIRKERKLYSRRLREIGR